MSQRTIILGVLQDIHNFGVRVLTYSLRKAGFNPIDLGTLLTQEDFIKAAIETDAKAILVSSSYGHAFIDCQGMREKCLEAGLGEILLYIGGNLVVTKQSQNWEDIEETFKQAGFHRVYPPDVTPAKVIEDLKYDLHLHSMKGIESNGH
jgi:methylaspartate mutase sigma subunit